MQGIYQKDTITGKMVDDDGRELITRSVAERLHHSTVLHHVREKNADGTPVRCRVNGACETWKTRPDDFRLPVKYGLKQCFYITPHNAHEWVAA